jgi:hypothetical protein
LGKINDATEAQGRQTKGGSCDGPERNMSVLTGEVHESSRIAGLGEGTKSLPGDRRERPENIHRC